MRVGVNLPRWGLKQFVKFQSGAETECKFTPLGFETYHVSTKRRIFDCVNLPRWGLKLYQIFDIDELFSV